MNGHLSENPVPQRRPVRHAILAFTLCFLGVAALYAAFILLVYSDELSGTASGGVLQLFLLLLVQLGSLALLFGILTGAAIYFRYRPVPADLLTGRGLATAATVVLVSFAWMAFLMPMAKYRELNQLYAKRAAGAGPGLGNIESMKRSASFLNFAELQKEIRILEQGVPPADNNAGGREHEMSAARLISLKKARLPMITWPILALELFYTGAFMGMACSRRNTAVVVLLCGLFMLGVICYLNKTAPLTQDEHISPVWVQAVQLVLFTLLNAGLYLRARRQRPEEAPML